MLLEMVKGLFSAMSRERQSVYMCSGEVGVLQKKYWISWCRAIVSALKELVGETKRNLWTACMVSRSEKTTNAAPADVEVWEPSVYACSPGRDMM